MLKQVITLIMFVVGLNSTYAGTLGESNSTYDFNGFYVGLGSGLTNLFNRDDHGTFNTLSSPIRVDSTQTRSSMTSILFDGHLGYGKFIKPNIYLGAKAFVYYTPLELSANDTSMSINRDVLITHNNSNQITVKPIYNIDAIFGYEIYPHVLPFIEGGVSFANVSSLDTQHNVESQLTNNANYGYTAVLNSNGYKTGYNVGIGTSYQMNTNWFISGELVYNYLGKHFATDTVNIPESAATDTISTNRMFQLVSLFASVSYLFPTL